MTHSLMISVLKLLIDIYYYYHYYIFLYIYTHYTPFFPIANS